MSNEANNPTPDRRFIVLVTTVTLMTIASGALYGHLTQRWGPPIDLVAAAEHVRNFPKQLGDWQLIQEDVMPDSTQRILKCAGYINRRYVSHKTGQSIGLAIIVGPPGPTAVHTPEICYSSRSYTIEDTPQKIAFDQQDQSFWGIRFQSRHIGAEQLQVYYAWNNGQRWEASDKPRIKFGGNRLLYKFQISGNLSLGTGKEITDPALEFTQALLSSSWLPKITSDN